MVRKSSLIALLLGLGLAALPGLAQTPVEPPPPPPPPPAETYWCTFSCVDGTVGGGPVTATPTESGGTLCNRLAAQVCRNHGGVRSLGLESYTPASGT